MRRLICTMIAVPMIAWAGGECAERRAACVQNCWAQYPTGTNAREERLQCQRECQEESDKCSKK